MSKTERKKKLRTYDIGYSSLNSVIEFANEVIKENPGMTLASFQVGYTEEPYSDQRYACLEYYTDETDDEMKARQLAEAAQRAQVEQWERKQYEQLKKKFGE